MSQLLSKVTVTSCIYMSNVQCVRLAAGRRSQAGDATRQWRDQRNAALRCFYQSQCSVATHLRCGGISSNSVITNIVLILMVKEF